MRLNVSKNGVKLIENITIAQLQSLISTIVSDRNINTGLSDIGGVLLNMVESIDNIVAGSGDPVTGVSVLASGVLRITLDSGATIDTASPLIGASFRAKNLADAAAVNALTVPITGDTAHVLDTDTLLGGSAGDAGLVYYTGAAWSVFWLASAGGGGTKSLDSSVVSGVTHNSKRFAGSASVLTNGGAGIYILTAQSGADVERIELQGDNGDLRPDNAFEFRFDNSANSEDREWVIQIKNLTTNQWSDLAALGINPVQTTAGNITTIVFSGMNGFGANGYLISLR